MVLVQDCARGGDVEVVLGGVYGSTAQGTDIVSSDLELLFVTCEGCKAEGKSFIFIRTFLLFKILNLINTYLIFQ